jgi:hypothetical protein
MADDWALDTLVKKSSKPNKKITKASQLICVHSLPMKCLWVLPLSFQLGELSRVTAVLPTSRAVLVNVLLIVDMSL